MTIKQATLLSQTRNKNKLRSHPECHLWPWDDSFCLYLFSFQKLTVIVKQKRE